MNAIIKIETSDDWYEAAVERATNHLTDAVNSWIAFCEEATAIQESGLWKAEAGTWATFVRQTWDIDASRIRQFKSALPYAKRITEALENIPTKEADIRKLKKAIPADHPMMPEVFALGKAVATELEKAVQTSFFNHALTVLETEKTSGFVEVTNGVQVPGAFEESRKWAVIKEIDEANQRLKARFMDKKRGVVVRAKRVVDNTYMITSREALPDNITFKIYLDEDE